MSVGVAYNHYCQCALHSNQHNTVLPTGAQALIAHPVYIALR